MDIHLASNFNVFDYIKPHENTLSDIFSDLLDANGKHGQGGIFLNEFLATIKQTEKVDIVECKVFREDTTTHIKNNMRRIDIALCFGNGFVISIENKPWDMEQDNQLQDYQEHLTRRYGSNWCLVYVSGDGSTPVSIKKNLREQLMKTGKLVVLSYKDDVVNWLVKCYKECKAEKIRFFIQDLITYIENSFDNTYEQTGGYGDE